MVIYYEKVFCNEKNGIDKMKNETTDKKHQLPTSGIVNCRFSACSSDTAHIKSSCNLIGKCFRNRQLTIPPNVRTHSKKTRNERYLNNF